MAHTLPIIGEAVYTHISRQLETDLTGLETALGNSYIQLSQENPLLLLLIAKNVELRDPNLEEDLSVAPLIYFLYYDQYEKGRCNFGASGLAKLSQNVIFSAYRITQLAIPSTYTSIMRETRELLRETDPKLDQLVVNYLHKIKANSSEFEAAINSNEFPRSISEKVENPINMFIHLHVASLVYYVLSEQAKSNMPPSRSIPQ